MSNLILPFAFSGLILLLAGLNTQTGFWKNLFYWNSLVYGVAFLGNICHLNNEGLDINNAHNVYLSGQIIFYLFGKFLSIDQNENKGL